jgi:peroxygenase
LSGLATYILLWPEDGIMRKEDIRKVYDGSIFYEIAAKQRSKKALGKRV